MAKALRTMPMQPAKRKAPSHGWKPGQSGNPGGRPKASVAVQELARQHTEAAIKTLAHLMEHSEVDRVRVAAAEALLDRAWGRPTMMLANPDGSGLFDGFAEKLGELSLADASRALNQLTVPDSTNVVQFPGRSAA